MFESPATCLRVDPKILVKSFMSSPPFWVSCPVWTFINLSNGEQSSRESMTIHCGPPLATLQIKR